MGHKDPPFLIGKRKENMKLQPIEIKIAEIIQPIVEEMELELFAVKISDQNGTQHLQVMAEDPKTKKLGIDDCAKLSRAIAALMDVEDPISKAYTLEVSSPGIDRILIKEEHFERYIGFEAKLESSVPAENGQKRFRGILQGYEDGRIKIKTDEGEAEVPFSALNKAKLVLTDELIKATAPQ